MNYSKIVDKIRSGTLSREELRTMKRNAEKLFQKGNSEAKIIIEEIDNATPLDSYFVFMGFCPGADFENRQDILWKEKGICRFDYKESKVQVDRFNELSTGDLIILKKREKFAKTMLLFGCGRVTGVDYDDTETRYLLMNWLPQDKEIEVPLMGCNSTVDVRTVKQVKENMPDKFFDWLSNAGALVT